MKRVILAAVLVAIMLGGAYRAWAQSHTITVSWTESPDFAAGMTHSIYRGTTPGGESATPIATGVVSSPYTDSNVVAGTTYYYKVSLVSGSISAMSAESSGCVVGLTPTGTPSCKAN